MHFDRAWPMKETWLPLPSFFQNKNLFENKKRKFKRKKEKKKWWGKVKRRWLIANGEVACRSTPFSPSCYYNYYLFCIECYCCYIYIYSTSFFCFFSSQKDVVVFAPLTFLFSVCCYFYFFYWRAKSPRWGATNTKSFISTGLNSFLIDWLAAHTARALHHVRWTPPLIFFLLCFIDNTTYGPHQRRADGSKHE